MLNSSSSSQGIIPSIEISQEISKNPSKSDSPLTQLVLQDKFKYNLHLIGISSPNKEDISSIEAKIDEIKPSYVIIELCEGRKAYILLEEDEVKKKLEEVRSWTLFKTVKETLKRSSSSVNGAVLGVFSYIWNQFLSDRQEVINFHRAIYKAAKKNKSHLFLGDLPIDSTCCKLVNNLSTVDIMQIMLRKFFQKLIVLIKKRKASASSAPTLTGDFLQDALFHYFGFALPSDVKTILLAERQQHLTYSILSCMKVVRKKHLEIRKKILTSQSTSSQSASDQSDDLNLSLFVPNALKKQQDAQLADRQDAQHVIEFADDDVENKNVLCIVGKDMLPGIEHYFNNHRDIDLKKITEAARIDLLKKLLWFLFFMFILGILIVNGYKLIRDPEFYKVLKNMASNASQQSNFQPKQTIQNSNLKK